MDAKTGIRRLGLLILRTILATLGLAFAGAALTGGVAAGPIVGGLAGGIAGNLATDLFTPLDQRMWDRFLAGWTGIDENHHIVAALRIAELAAVRAILDRYLALQVGEDDRVGQRLAEQTVSTLGGYVSQEIKRAQKRDLGGPPELARFSFLPATFDAALAARRAPDAEPLLAKSLIYRRIAESVVLEELRTACGDVTKAMPSLLETVFLGGDEPGWFDLFVREAADRIANPEPAFAASWNAEQLSLIRALVDASNSAISATDINVKLLAARFESGLLLLESIGARIDAVRDHLDEVRALLASQRVGAPVALSAPRPRPSGLPEPPADFVGRSEQRISLGQELRAGGRGLISAVRGMGGIGKTSLAALVGRDIADAFPDGCFWLDLKGSRPGVSVDAHEALGKLIHQIDLFASLADGTEARAAQFRGLATGRRMLIVLDDARDAAQCAELLPPAANALLITSRRAFHLPGLRPHELPLLDAEEATMLLSDVAGSGGRRFSDEELAAIVERCGRLPLALRSAGAFLSENSDWGTVDYLARLSSERGRLDALRTGDPDLDVRAVLKFSFTQLEKEQPALAKRWVALSVVPGSFDIEAVAAIWSCNADEARDAVSALVRRAMLEFDAGRQRYRFHDLMRDLAEELGLDQDPARDAR